MRNSNDNRNLLTPDRILFELHNLEFVTVTWSDKGEQDSDDQIDNLCALQPKPQASPLLFLWREEMMYGRFLCTTTCRFLLTLLPRLQIL